MNRTIPLLAASALLALGCNWIATAKNALTYETIARGEAANVAIMDSFAYATLAEDGLAVLDARTGRRLSTLPPPPGLESIDDLAVADGFLFVLDARTPGHLGLYSLADPLHPRFVARARDVPVGPFSGVSANAGLCIVSGGTSELTAWRYDSAGGLAEGGPVATTDLGRGQPDVLVAPRGDLAYVSSHYRGPYFGLDVVRYDAAASRLVTAAVLPLDGAGFTSGGARPANFPIEAAIVGDTLVLIAHERGLAVINAADPAAPRLTGRIDVGGAAVNVDTRGSLAVVSVAGAAPALVLVDFSGPGSQGHIVRRISLPAGIKPTGTALGDQSVLVAARDRGVLAFAR
jgi:hypothetical protein